MAQDDTITLTIRYHALLREKTGRNEAALTFPSSTCVRDVVAQLGEAYPALKPLLSSITVAVNDEFADADQALRAGDSVDLLPPFGGG